MKKQAAIFIDRDGTIIQDNGYIDQIEMVDFYPYTLASLQKLQKSYLLFIITNQSGISKGLISEEKVILINQHIEEYLRTNKINITATYYCPHTDQDNCYCKKPSPYFIEQAAKEYALDLSSSYMIGDHPSDVGCGIKAGVTPIYLLSGHGSKHQKELTDNPQICKDLEEATNLILSI